MIEDIRDGLRGKVKAFLKLRGFGFAIPIDTEGNPTGEPDLFFHINDGHFVYEASPGVVGWYFQYLHEYERLRDPVKGDTIVYDKGRDSHDRPKARLWTYEDHLIHERTKVSMKEYRLSDDQGPELWFGKYSPVYDVLDSYGKLPDQLEPGVTLKCYVISNPGTAEYSAGWEPVENPEEVFAKLQQAKPFSRT